MLPGILSSTWNLIKSSKAPGSCQGGVVWGFWAEHTSSSASQGETERSQRSRVGTSDNGTLWIFHHSFFREGNKCLVLFHHYITYNNQKSVPTNFFFFLNRASLPKTLASCATLLAPHGVSGDDRVRHLDNSLPTRLDAPFIDPQSSITPLIWHYLPGQTVWPYSVLSYSTTTTLRDCEGNYSDFAIQWSKLLSGNSVC